MFAGFQLKSDGNMPSTVRAGEREYSGASRQLSPERAQREHANVASARRKAIDRVRQTANGVQRRVRVHIAAKAAVRGTNANFHQVRWIVVDDRDLQSAKPVVHVRRP